MKLIFKIDGMCCAEEIATLKTTLSPLLHGKEELLAFDLINEKLTVERNSSLLTEDEIIKAIARTGMKAIPWNDHNNQTHQGQTFWQRAGHFIMTAASGLSFAAGFIVHSVMHGISNAFSSGEEEKQTYPTASIVLYSTAIVTGGWYVFPKALRAIRRLRPDMNLLMTIAVGGAAAIDQWFEAAAISFLFSSSLLLESWNMRRARKAIRALMELAPATARVVDKDITIERLVEEIPVGTTVTVRPGEKIPMDSILISGSTSVNQAPITGESMPVRKEIGDELFAGTINGDNAIQCRVEKAAQDSTVARIIRMVEEAQSRRSASEQWVEKFAHYYTPSMMLLAALVMVAMPIIYDDPWDAWIYEGLVILVIACPCALVISTPVSITAGLNSAARSGVLIKGGMFLEMPAHIKAIAMDKTGTLTTGEPIVQEIIPLNEHSEEDLLKRAISLEAHSDHPLARAIQHKAEAAGIVSQPAEHFQIVKGKGAEGYIGEILFWIGSHRFLHEKVGSLEPTSLHEKAQELETKGHSIVAIGHDQHICGLISIADAVREGCKEAIQALTQVGIRNIIMLTGDNEGTACAIAKSVGIDEYHAELLPEDKVKQVESLVTKYQHVAMVGDGINDAPAMAASSLGIVMGAAGSDAAIETADIALMSDDLGKLAWLVKHSRRTLNIIKQNIVFSLSTKGIFITLALAGKASLWMAIAADIGTSFIVVGNGLRLLNNSAEKDADSLPGLQRFGMFGKDTRSPVLATESVGQDPLQERSKVIARILDQLLTGDGGGYVLERGEENTWLIREGSERTEGQLKLDLEARQITFFHGGTYHELSDADRYLPLFKYSIRATASIT